MAKEYLSAKPPYVVVEKGDTLSKIAETYGAYIAGSGIYGTGGKLETLVKLNDITDANFIVVGQKIQLSGTSTAKKNTSNAPTIKAFGLQSNSNTVYATWTWSKSNTENYKVIWQYDTGNGVWFDGSASTTTSKQSTYGIPSNANKVRFKVRPISKKRKVNGKETSYWTASWSSIKTYEVKNNPPATPSISSSNIKIDASNQLTIEMTNLDTSVNGLNASTVQFQIYRNSTKLVHTGKATISSLGYLKYSWKASAGYRYSVRCRSVRGSIYSDWTDLTEDVWSMPAAPSRIIECSSYSDTSIYLTWSGVSAAVTYTIQYIPLPKDASSIAIPKNQTYFDVYSSLIQTAEATPEKAGATPPTFKYINNLTLGTDYCFRVRSNGSGSDMVSDWTKPVVITLGTTPAQPTTWSSATKVMVGEQLTLYWIHNSEDESTPSAAKIYFSIKTADGNYDYVHTVDYDGTNSKVNVEDGNGKEVTFEEDENGNFITNAVNAFKGLFTASTSTTSTGDKDKTQISKYEIQTSNFSEGAEITWYVRTKGVKPEYSEPSIIREFSILDYPEMSIEFTGNVGVSELEELDFVCYQLPIQATINVDSNLQSPIGYHINIIAGEQYETVDDVGNVKVINSNDSVYSNYFDISDSPFEITLSAGDIELENNVLYTFTCSAALDSGLGVMQTATFRVLWEEEQYCPNAEISIDMDSLTASIRPFCEDEVGVIVENVLLSVYRRDFDGNFVELIRDVENTSATFVTDPHPALDYARYRIVARDKNTGGVSFYDVPGYPVGETAAVLQWNEDWTNFDITNDNWTNDDIATEQSTAVWSGSILKLPYNIDVSDSNSRDVELVKYIGRKNPVSYYGTQVGHTSSWSVSVPKFDRETIHMLRQLQAWMGDVYVREPYGSGYWASVSVSFNQNHCETVVPVTIDITRVEGGV